MKKVKLALVGCGPRGVRVGKLFASYPQCEITAIVDMFIGKAETVREDFKLPDAKLYTDYAKMLAESDVDTVFIASDPLSQVDMACEAMEKGRHVCTEVPAAFSIDECWKLVETVERTGRKYQLMEQARYWGYTDECRKMNEAGVFGHICMAQGEYFHYNRNWGYWDDLDSGEKLNDLERPANRNVVPNWRYKLLGEPIYYLPHTLSPILKILDDRVVNVACMGTRRQSYTYPESKLEWSDMEYALMHTAKDTVILAGAGFSMPCVRRGPLECHWQEIRGTKASASTPRFPGDCFRLWKEGMATYESVPWSSVPLGANEEQAKTGHGGTDFKPVDTFIQAIINDATPPMDVYLSVETAAPAILAAESARKGGILLDVPDFRKGRG